MKSFNYLFFLAGFIGHICAAQSSDLKSIEEVISGIDSLLEQIDESSSIKSESTKLKNQELQSTNPPGQRSYRLENELMPEELRVPINDLPVDQIGKAGNPPGASPQDPLLNPVSNKPTISTLPRSVDYSKLSLDDLLREVDMLKNPSMPGLGTIIEPLPVSSTSPDKGVAEHLLLPTKEYSQSELPEIEPAVIQDASRPNSPTEIDIVVDDYIVLGNEIDQELKEKIREAVMATRMSSGGTGNPFVTRSVHKATSFCNRVLGRLTAPVHKRYRRDILLALINMHEKNNAWVDAAKSYERFLEEFASDDDYPFRATRRRPGYSDLHA